MAKPKSPLLSLGARGTIANALTFQKRGTGTIVREKPIPKDPYSLAQAYQRWDYRDYAYLWTLLSNSEKQVYRTKASKYHITGFSQWMREKLKDLPDIMGRWHLDEIGGATAYDSSRNTNHGTIFGASPTDGVIDGAFSFDGLNDYVNVPDDPTIRVILPFSIELFFNRAPGITNIEILAKIIEPVWLAASLEFNAAGNIRVLFNNGGLLFPTSPLTYDDGVAHHLVSNFALTGVYIYIDGYWVAEALGAPADIDTTGHPFRIGWGEQAPGFEFQGIIDHVVLRNRILDATEILRHSKRRYPV